MSCTASRNSARRLSVALGLAFCSVLACGGSGDHGPTGTGGSGDTSGSAGTTGSGGAAGTTGAAGTGGATAGVGGTSGSVGIAGTSGSAGVAGTGGSAGAAGTGGSAGAAGTGGATGNAGRGGNTAGSGGGGMSGRGGTGGAGGATGGGRGGSTAGTGGSGGSGGGGTQAWVGTWATGPQLTETSNNPPSPGLTNNTLRQVVFSSISGSQLRLRLSNEFGDGPVTINAVHIALSTSGSSITTSTDKAVTFGGAAGVTIAQNQAVNSDPFDFALPALTKVAITIAFGNTPAGITGHPGARMNSFLVAGNMVGAATLSGAAMAEHWYYIVGLDVMAPAGTAAVVTLGDSITDGARVDDRHEQPLARRLLPAAASERADHEQGRGPQPGHRRQRRPERRPGPDSASALHA